MTYALMALLVCFLGFLLLFKAKVADDSTHFFDLENTTAMRGFWCIIVVLVHVPVIYQNKIQDLIGSFAYIGVTFFFMTSAYGLTLSLKKNPETIKTFWRKRLPKLLVPMLIINILNICAKLVEGNSVSVLNLLTVNTWVIWLLGCYLVFYIVNILHIGGGYSNLIVCILIAVASITIYALNKFELINIGTTWCPEVFGFVWGIVLVVVKDKVIELSEKKWLLKCFIVCCVAALFGVAYLKLKYIPVFGDYILKIALGLSIILFMLMLNTKISIDNKVSLFLGKISYEVYLLHGIVFGLLASFTEQWNSGVFILLSILITVAISFLVWLASKPINKGLGKLLIRNTESKSQN